ncbi:MAG: restriction endonuclease [bacterium]|nr:restriction endonuclease [bacterium]
MLDSLLGAAGILVSILLFLAGYRQTVGAKKERIRSANADVEKILVRRVVLEGYIPSRSNVARLLEGKARDFRVSEDELLSEAQVLNALYTRIVESDLIPPDQREQILKQIVPSLTESETSPIEEDEASTARVSRMLRTSNLLLGLLAGATSIVGGVVSVFPELRTSSADLRELLLPALATVGASLAVLSAMIAFYRLRASQETLSTKAGEVRRYISFEMDVARVLRRLGVKVRRAEPTEGADFIVDLRGKKVLIEVKAWNRPMPTRVIGQLVERLTGSLRRAEAAEAVVVTPEPLRYPVPLPPDSNVKFMTLHELRNYVAHSGNDGTAA